MTVSIVCFSSIQGDVMKGKQIILGTLAYTLVTFPLAVVWHVVLFEEMYRTFGYFDGEPSFVLGFLTILIQGFMLSLLYPYFNLPGQVPILAWLRSHDT